jgi:Sulfotransferase family
MIIFSHIPKTGGTSFRFILENSFGISHCHANHAKKPVFAQDDLEFAKKFFPRLRSIAGHSLVNPLNLSVANPFYITFLREPISRVISHYQYSVALGNNRKTFEESLRAEGKFENLQVKIIAGERNLEKAKHSLEKFDFVGLTEQFDLSLRVLERLAPCKLNLNYKRKVVAKDNSIKKSLQGNARLMEMAAEINQLDMELYAFVVNTIFPKLCERAGINPAAKAKSYDTYSNELKLKYVIGRLYNKFYRQVCKFRR